MWGELYENYHYRADLSFELQFIMVFKITWEICVNFFPLECKFKVNFEISKF
jgi:hypothetical protein